MKDKRTKVSARLAMTAGLGLALTVGGVPVAALASTIETVPVAESGQEAQPVTGIENGDAQDGQTAESEVSTQDVTVNSSSQTSVQLAINGAPKDGTVTTIHLDEDVTNQFFAISPGQNIVLDLGGSKLTLTSGNTVSDNLQASEAASSSIAITNRGTLTIQNGTIDCTQFGAIANFGTLSIGSNASITCSSSTFTGGHVITNYGGTVEVSGSLSSNVGCGISTYGGTVEITGGTLSFDSETAHPSSGGPGGASVIDIFSRDYTATGDGADVIISGGTLSSYSYVASGNNLHSADSSLMITGGAISSHRTCLYWSFPGTLTIGSEGLESGPTITSTNGSAVDVCDGTLNIYGGTLSGGTELSGNDVVETTDQWVAAMGQNSGSGNFGDAVTIATHRGKGYAGPLTVNIEGGSFSSLSNYAVRYMDCNKVREPDNAIDQDAEVSISGGVFDGSIADVDAEFVEEADQKFITGGTFAGSGEESVLADYIAEGNMLDGSGNVVINQETAVASVNGVGYTSIASAIEAAKEGDTVIIGPGNHELGDNTTFLIDKRITIQGADETSAITCKGTNATGHGLFTFTKGSAGSKLSGLSIDYTGTQADCAAIYFDGGFGGNAGNVTTISNVKIDGNVADGNSNQSIGILSAYIDAGNIKVEGCTLENLKYGMYFNNVQGLDVINNTIENTQYNAINIAADSSAMESGNITISGNFMTNIGTAKYNEVVYNSGVNVGNKLSGTVSVADNQVSMASPDAPAVNFVESEGGLSTTFTATFMNGGEEYAKLVTIVANGTATFTAPAAPSRPGYTFIGWSDGESTYQAGAEIILSQDAEFIALWSRNYVPSTPSKPTYDVTVPVAEGGKVSLSDTTPEAGDEVVITVTPDVGQEVRSVVVTDADGETVDVEANGDGTWSFKQPKDDVTVTVTFGCDGGELCPSHGFDDVNTSEWYHDAIDWAVENGVLKGSASDGMMHPDDDITRAQVAQVLYNVEKAAPGDQALLAQFADASPDAWYADALSWAVAEGIFQGWEAADGSMFVNPDAPISREQAAMVLMRWTEMNGGDVSQRGDLSRFPDADGVSPWATEAMSWAVGSGTLTGVEHVGGENTLDAAGVTSRAQAATLMMRLLSE